MDEKRVEVSESIKTSSFKSRLKNFFKQKTLVLLLTVGCIIYAFTDVIKWKINEADFYVLILQLIIATFFYFYVVNIMGKMGLKNGKENELFVATMKWYGKRKDEIEPIRSHLNEYVRYKTEQDRLSLQKAILDSEGLQFEKLDEYDVNKLTKSELKAIKRAKTIKVSRLLEKDLVSERGHSNKAKYGTYLGKTEKSFEMQQNLSTILSKLLIPIAITYISIESISMQNLLAGLIKTIMILFSGLLNYVKCEDFAINDLRNRFINKADCLAEFKNMYEAKQGCFEYLKEEEAKIETDNEVDDSTNDQKELKKFAKRFDTKFTREDILNAKSEEELPFNTLPSKLTLEEKKEMLLLLLDFDKNKNE